MHGDRTITTINISTLSFIKVLIILGVLASFYILRDVLAIIFIALILSSAMGPWVTSLERKGLPRMLGILLIYLLMISGFGLVVLLIIPPMTYEFNLLAQQFPFYAERMLQLLRDLNSDYNLVQQFKDSIQSIQSGLVDVASNVFSKLYDFVRGFVAFIAIFVVTFYIIAEETALRKLVHTVVPVKYQPYLEDVIGRIQGKIGQWLRGQMILCFIIFTLTFIGLSILGVNYVLLLAILAGILEFIPVIGPTIAAIPALFVAFSQSPILAFWVLLLYILIQQLENHLLVPRIMERTVGINPLISIIALLIGAEIAGIIGVLLAIPVATIVIIIIQDFIGPGREDTHSLAVEN
ncbi:AI-2E family transporter [Candidatus Uhrbacteria bacterium]|nr:AI-2E family transporter [Candidatus Uhrbacteria bacterium]